MQRSSEKTFLWRIQNGIQPANFVRGLKRRWHKLLRKLGGKGPYYPLTRVQRRAVLNKPMPPKPEARGVVIEDPGTYFLNRDMDVAYSAAIRIASSNVVLDLSGHSIRKVEGDGPESIGIVVVGAQRNVTIRGGRITGFRHGIVAAHCKDLHVLGVDVSGSLKAGITAGGDRTRIIGCVADSIGGAPAEAYAVGINLVGGEDMLVERCRITNIYRQPGAEAGAVGEGCAIICAARTVSSRVYANILVNDRAEPKTIGIFGGGGGTHMIENNLIRNFHLGIQGGGKPESPTNASGNVLSIQRSLPESEGLCIAYGQLEGNLVTGFERSGRSAQERALNTVFDHDVVFSTLTEAAEEA